MENIIFFVVVALVGLVQLVMRILEARNNAQAEKKSAPPAANAPIPRAPAETEEERVRKFFEALGVPSTSTPPPRVQPPLRPATERAPRPKRTIMPVDPFPIPRAGQPVPPAVAGAPPFPVSPVVPRESVPLPTRETSVFADLPIPAKPPHRLAAEFEVRNIEFCGEALRWLGGNRIRKHARLARGQRR